MFEAAAYLLDVIHAEKDIERAVDVRIEFCGAIDRLAAQREVERHQAVIAPVPGIELLAHVLREQVFAGHSMVVGASMALAMKRLPSTAPPSSRRTPVARPFRTTISLTSAP